MGECDKVLRSSKKSDPGPAKREERQNPAAAQKARGWRRMLLLCLAGASLITGVAGVFLPILPTTPFVLLSSFLLVRSSPRLHATLVRSRLFGPIIRDWQVHGGIRRGLKLKAVGVVVLAVGLTIYLSDFSLIPTLSVSLLAAIGIGVIMRLPTAR